MNFFKTVNAIREAGADVAPVEERKKILLVNTLSLFTAFCAFTIGSLLYFITWKTDILFPAVVEGICFVGVILLNRYHFYTAASIIMLAIQNLAALAFAFILGGIAASALELLMLCLVSCALIIFSSTSFRIYAILLASFCVFAFEFNFYHQIFQPQDLIMKDQFLIRWLAVGVIFIMNLMVILYYVMQNDRAKKLEASDIYKTLFVQETSHEIRSPLNAIFGMSQLLLLTIEKQKNKKAVDVEVIKPLAEHLFTASYNLKGIISNILELSKIQAGKPDELKKDHFRVIEWIRDLVNVQSYNSRQKGVSITVEATAAMPEVLVTDLLKLTQIINNLLSNAIKFTKDNSTIRLKIFARENNWYIQVNDQGPGINDRIRDNIFDPFVTEKVELYESTGLGLSITKKLAEQLGGALHLESTSREGTTFTVVLPLVEGNPDNVIRTAPMAPVMANYKGIKILVIEDNLMSQLVIIKFLKELECKIAVASDGLEGLEIAKKDPPDLIFLDTHMPVLSGLETLKAIRENTRLKNVPVVAVSGDAFKETIDEVILAGANDYITKPVDFKQVHMLLGKYCRHN